MPSLGSRMSSLLGRPFQPLQKTFASRRVVDRPSAPHTPPNGTRASITTQVYYLCLHNFFCHEAVSVDVHGTGLADTGARAKMTRDVFVVLLTAPLVLI